MTLIKKTFEDFAITEKRLKPITKNHWKKASDDQKEEWLLQAFSDPDDAEEFIESTDFNGTKTGYIYKYGDKGMGYYKVNSTSVPLTN